MPVTFTHGWAALLTNMSSTQLWEHFCVVGLSQSLITAQGEQGWFGSEQKYKPHLLDSLPPDASSRVPPELPTCCLPAGVDILLHADVTGKAEPLPQAFAFILTGMQVSSSMIAKATCMQGAWHTGHTQTQQTACKQIAWLLDSRLLTVELSCSCRR
eukprot:GHUV01016389.1.p1 GENE.GHUV01016389.1~~GHUV01016389.1.p1  ORF type:complete len:157 (+),score=21.46 GHUV01016389.1:208-678(+)